MIVRSAAFLDGSEKAVEQWKPRGTFPVRGRFLSPKRGEGLT
jgi:hypothetical protein